MILIDPGHGGSATGAQYKQGKFLAEKDLTLSIAHRVGQLCDWHGASYQMTRTTDQHVTLSERVGQANRIQADVFCSIHCNWFSSSKAGGYEVWHYPGSTAGEKYAEQIVNEMISTVDLNNRGVKEADNKPDFDTTPYIKVLQGTVMPSVLVECGFLSNIKDREYLQTTDGMNAIAESIYKGLTHKGG